MKRNFIKFLLVTFLFLLFIFISTYSYAKSIFDDLSANIFRLHIIANSDSTEDQELKLKVRDKIIEYLKEKTQNLKTKDEVMNFTIDNIEELQKIAVKTVKENGYDYNITLEVGNFYFPTKYYGNVSMPAGNYDGLNIKIGSASGHNWWCSLFPALCFTNISNGLVSQDAKNILSENLTDEEYNLLFRKSSETKLKFKIIEFLNSF